jgi:hypothetical protein
MKYGHHDDKEPLSLLARVLVKLIGGIINNNKFLCSPLVIDTCASECKKSNLSAGAAAVLGILILAIRPPSVTILNLFQQCAMCTSLEQTVGSRALLMIGGTSLGH